ncbi:hypothetical protein N9T81_01185 [Flavobacteriaceae bacterium]|jgi:hypothetical protein|nr:hypothetical protein [Flavobacteriaceae bacterium]
MKVVNERPFEELVEITLITCGIKAIVVNIAAINPIISTLSIIKRFIKSI